MFVYMKLRFYVCFVLFYEYKYINPLLLNDKYDVDLFVF